MPEKIETPIPDTPECVSSHCGVYACRADEINTMYRLIQSGTVHTKSAAELEEARQAPALYEVTPEGVAIIPVSGIMQRSESKFGGVASTVRLRNMMRSVRKDDSVRGVMLRVDSPGGAVAGQTEMMDDLRRLAAEKPVWSSIDEIACSAAYWLVSETARISSNPLAIVGNVGCYCVAYDTTGQQARDGVRVVMVSSGRYKGLGADGAVPADMVEEMQKRVDQVNAVFASSVAAGRGMTLERAFELADGKSYSGAEAIEAGLIDAIETFDEAMSEFVAYLNQKENEKMEDEKKMVGAFQALADSDGYEFAKAHFGESPEQIEMARKEAKISALLAENDQLKADKKTLSDNLAAANERAGKAEEARAAAEKRLELRAKGEDLPVGIQPEKNEEKTGKRSMYAGGKLNKK